MSDLRITASAVSVLLTPQREPGAVGGGDVLADLGVQVSTDSLCPEDQVVRSCHSGPRRHVG